MKLEPNLIPESSFFSNVRNMVKASEWDILRKATYQRAGWHCEVCGGQGRQHPVECHEVWEYDEGKGIQKLVKLTALCPACHEVNHFGLAQIRGRKEPAVRHMMKVNQITRAQALEAIGKAFTVWHRRSLREWTINIEMLKTLKEKS